MLGIQRAKLIGRKLDDFVAPHLKPRVSELWKAFLNEGEWKAPISLKGADGKQVAVELKAKTNVLPERHLVALSDGPIPAWVQDYAVFLIDVEGFVVAWYAGAQRIHGYSSGDALGKNISCTPPKTI